MNRLDYWLSTLTVTVIIGVYLMIIVLAHHSDLRVCEYYGYNRAVTTIGLDSTCIKTDQGVEIDRSLGDLLENGEKK